MNDLKTIYLYPENISKIDISKIIDRFPFKNHHKSIKFVSYKDFFILKNSKNNITKQQQKQYNNQDKYPYLKQKVFNQLNEDFIPEIYKNNDLDDKKYFIFKKHDLFKKIEFIPTIQYIPKDYEIIKTDILKLKTQRNSNISLVIEFLSDNKFSNKKEYKIIDFYIKVKRITDCGIQVIEDNEELRSFLNLLIFT